MVFIYEHLLCLPFHRNKKPYFFSILFMNLYIHVDAYINSCSSWKSYWNLWFSFHNTAFIFTSISWATKKNIKILWWCSSSPFRHSRKAPSSPPLIAPSSSPHIWHFQVNVFSSASNLFFHSHRSNAVCASNIYVLSVDDRTKEEEEKKSYRVIILKHHRRWRRTAPISLRFWKFDF